jgi:hypothetical protein
MAVSDNPFKLRRFLKFESARPVLVFGNGIQAERARLAFAMYFHLVGRSAERLPMGVLGGCSCRASHLVELTRW